MTADEALVIVETVLSNEDRLNNVQELIFRECWEGRQSYKDIAKISQYNDQYIKSTAAKLWKLLSEAFGEKVKQSNLKSVIKRYLRRTQVNLYGNQAIQVNFSGANLRGANLSDTRICANLVQSDLCQVSFPGSVKPEIFTKSNEKSTDIVSEENQANQPNSEGEIYWNGWSFRSEAEVKIAEALDRAGVLFSPNFWVRLTASTGRHNQQLSFLIFHKGNWGLLEVCGETENQDLTKDEEYDLLFRHSGIRIAKYYDAKRCSEQADKVVQEFIEILSQV